MIVCLLRRAQQSHLIIIKIIIFNYYYYFFFFKLLFVCNYFQTEEGSEVDSEFVADNAASSSLSSPARCTDTEMKQGKWSIKEGIILEYYVSQTLTASRALVWF